MKIYLDVCCLNRPFDDQSNLRVHLESEAVKTILSLCEQTQWQLLSSEVIEFEIANTIDEDKRTQLQQMTAMATLIPPLTTEVLARAQFLETAGLTVFDAMHLACAETHADIFLTVDDKFLKKARSLTRLGVNNPLKWLEEVLP